LLLLLRAPAQEFRIAFAGIELAGVLGAVEHRRALWWDAVRKLSRIDAERRMSFIEVAHLHFRMERSLDHFLESYPLAERHFCLLTKPELQQLAASGMTIGAHTLTHSILSQMPDELAWGEIASSRARLEAVIGKPIWAFAYPFGDTSSVSPAVIAMAKQAGYEAAFLNVGGGLGAKLAPYTIPRVHVNAGIRLAEFDAHVSGFYGSLQRHMGRTSVPPGIDTSLSTPLPIPRPIASAKTA